MSNLMIEIINDHQLDTRSIINGLRIHLKTLAREIMSVDHRKKFKSLRSVFTAQIEKHPKSESTQKKKSRNE